MKIRLLAAWLILIAIFATPLLGQSRRRPQVLPFLATAYAINGITKAGTPTKPGVVAADTDVLPLGTKIQVTNAGPHSGIYTVTDTGSKVRGRHIDIYLPSWARAKEFGRKIVHVRVLRWGGAK
jgi:3D (Asp-Asp-Asp) domain-containing protein